MYICIYCHGLSSSPFCFILVSFHSLPFSPVPNRSSLARIRSVSRRICPTRTDIISVRNRDLRVFVRTRSNKAERKRRPLPSSRAIDHRSQHSFPELRPNAANKTTCTIFLSKFTSKLAFCFLSSDAFLTSHFLRRFLSFPERFCRLNLCGRSNWRASLQLRRYLIIFAICKILTKMLRSGNEKVRIQSGRSRNCAWQFPTDRLTIVNSRIVRRDRKNDIAYVHEPYGSKDRTIGSTHSHTHVTRSLCPSILFFKFISIPIKAVKVKWLS